jgi:hypothetical protein
VVTIYSQLKTLRDQDRGWAYQMATGVLFQMRRVLESGRRVGTSDYPQLTGVEVHIPAYKHGRKIVEKARVDYTVKDRGLKKTEIVEVGVEVKRYGATWDAEKVSREITKIRRQIRGVILSDNPKYDVVRLEIGGYDNADKSFKNKLRELWKELRAEARERSIRLEPPVGLEA